MAVTERKPIKEQLAFYNTVFYGPNKKKTDHGTLVTSVNCSINPKVAYRQMLAHKRNFNKEGGILGFHFYQSFKPGEIKDPYFAHKLGLEWADKFLKNHQFILSTHIDKAHIHNHIVINSVGLDGRKYNSNTRELREIRRLSDEICRENNLHVIETNGRGKHYKEWLEDKRGRSWKSIIKDDIDKSIRQSNSFEEFLSLMKKNEYQIKQGRVKYMTFKKEGMGRNIRGKTLGNDYTEERIKERIRLKEFDLQTCKTQGRRAYRLNNKNNINFNRFKYRRGNLSTNIQLTIALINVIMTKNSKILPKRRYKNVKGYSNTAIKKLTAQLEFINKNNLQSRRDILKALDNIEVRMKETKDVVGKMNELKGKMDIIYLSIENYNKYKPYADEYKRATLMKPIIEKKYLNELRLFNASKSKLDSFGLKNDDDFGIFIEKYQEHIKRIDEINLNLSKIENNKKSYLELEETLRKLQEKTYIKNIKDTHGKDVPSKVRQRDER